MAIAHPLLRPRDGSTLTSNDREVVVMMLLGRRASCMPRALWDDFEWGRRNRVHPHVPHGPSVATKHCCRHCHHHPPPEDRRRLERRDNKNKRKQRSSHIDNGMEEGDGHPSSLNNVPDNGPGRAVNDVDDIDIDIYGQHDGIHLVNAQGGSTTQMAQPPWPRWPLRPIFVIRCGRRRLCRPTTTPWTQSQVLNRTMRPTDD